MLGIQAVGVSGQTRLPTSSRSGMKNPFRGHLIQSRVRKVKLTRSRNGIGHSKYSFFNRTATSTVTTIPLACFSSGAHPLFTRFVLWHSVEKNLIFL